jgi:hypothetical protein
VKRRLAGLWLLGFALWPVAQHWLTRSNDMDAWRFAGWATLAVPRLPPNVVLFQVILRGAQTTDDIQAAKIDPAQLSSELRAELARFTAVRTAYGRLAPPPERLGRKLLAERGETGMVLVVVQSRTLNRGSGRIETSLEKHVYSDREKVRSEIGAGT